VLVALGALLVVLVLIALAAPSRRNDGPSLDPTSTGATGTRAAVEVAGRLGADVEVSSSLPDDDVDVALVFEDLLDGVAADRITTWVERGGTLVVAAPSSLLTPPAELEAVDPFSDELRVARDGCDAVRPEGLDALGGLASHGPVARFDVPDGSQACFDDGTGAVVVVTPVGDGLLVSVGTPWVFTNEALDQADNAGLLAVLAVPEPGTRLAVLVAGEDGSDLRPSSDGGLGLPTGVSLAVVQALVAFVVYALFRSRRLGKPVPEDPPVVIAGSELTRAVGGLMEHAGTRDRAAASLRRAARARLASAFGLPAGADATAVALTVAHRTGLDADRLERALIDGPVPDDDALAALGRELDGLLDRALTRPDRATDGAPSDLSPPAPSDLSPPAPSDLSPPAPGGSQ
jgi:hypothetical protein